MRKFRYSRWDTTAADAVQSDSVFDQLNDYMNDTGDLQQAMRRLLQRLALLRGDPHEGRLCLLLRRLEPILLVELPHLARDLREEILHAGDTVFALFEAPLHQAAHRLPQVARGAHVVVLLIV